MSHYSISPHCRVVKVCTPGRGFVKGLIDKLEPSGFYEVIDSSGRVVVRSSTSEGLPKETAEDIACALNEARNKRTEAGYGFCQSNASRLAGRMNEAVAARQPANQSHKARTTQQGTR